MLSLAGCLLLASRREREDVKQPECQTSKHRSRKFALRNQTLRNSRLLNFSATEITRPTVKRAVADEATRQHDFCGIGGVASDQGLEALALSDVLPVVLPSLLSCNSSYLLRIGTTATTDTACRSLASSTAASEAFPLRRLTQELGSNGRTRGPSSANVGCLGAGLVKSSSSGGPAQWMRNTGTTDL